MEATGQMWFPPPSTPAMPADEVHVWRVSLEQPHRRLAQLSSLLSPDERERAAQFHFERDRRRFVVARGFLRTIIGRYTGLAPVCVRFYYGERGKPSLMQEGTERPLYFNLSHAHELALYGFSRSGSIGVDVEHLRPIADMEAIVARFFSVYEQTVWRALPDDQRETAFYNCWTRKEAYIKAVGEGLAQPLDRFDVSLAPGEPACLLRVAGEPEAPSRWSLAAIAPAAGYVAAVAVEQPRMRLRCWQQL